MGSLFTGQQRQTNSWDRIETSPFQQTFLFDDPTMQALRGQIGGATQHLFDSVDFSSPGAMGNWMNQFMGAAGMGPGGVGAGFDPASAGRFTKEFDPILEKLTQGPMVEKALSQFIDPIQAQTGRMEEGLLQRAAARGIDLSSGQVGQEMTRNLMSAEDQMARARAQAYLGSLGEAVGATSNQVNAITQAEMANAQASATASAAAAAANAQMYSANMAARGGMAANLMGLPLDYMRALAPTFTQGQQFAPVNTGTTSSQKPGLFDVGAMAFKAFV